jgi:hypothetical protein
VSWQDDSIERDWEGKIDRAADARARDEHMRRIRAEAEIRDADRRVSRARSALERETAHRHILDERDALMRRLADCAWLDDAIRERWAERIDEIGNGAGRAAVERLSNDVVEVCAALQRNLDGIGGVLARDVERQADVGAPPLVALNRARREAHSQAVLARTRIRSCAHLNAELREKWLRLLPEPDESLRWLRSTGPRTAAGLRREVMGLSEAVARFSSRMRDGFTVIKVELERLSAE